MSSHFDRPRPGFDAALAEIDARAAEREQAAKADAFANDPKHEEARRSVAHDPKVAAPPTRFKTIHELTAEEHLRHMKTGQLPESDDFRAYRSAALRNAGLPEDDEPSGESLTVADHLARLHRN